VGFEQVRRARAFGCIRARGGGVGGVDAGRAAPNRVCWGMLRRVSDREPSNTPRPAVNAARTRRLACAPRSPGRPPASHKGEIVTGLPCSVRDEYYFLCLKSFSVFPSAWYKNFSLFSSSYHKTICEPVRYSKRWFLLTCQSSGFPKRIARMAVVNLCQTVRLRRRPLSHCRQSHLARRDPRFTVMTNSTLKHSNCCPSPFVRKSGFT
jgi:hypothetical protein